MRKAAKVAEANAKIKELKAEEQKNEILKFVHQFMKIDYVAHV